MIEMHEIRYFIALARELHFGRAAAACCVSQPALTRAIRKLEEKFGGLLIDRRPGQIELTELGRSVLPRLQAAWAEVDVARDVANAIQTSRLSTLRLGVMCTAGPARIMPLINRFVKRENDIELIIREARAGSIIDLLLADDIDIGIAAWPDYPDAIERFPCYVERYAVAVPRGHALEHHETIALASLSGEQYLQRLNCEFDDHFAKQVGEWPLDLLTRFSSEREDWIQSLITSGEGIAIVPEFMDVGDDIAVRPMVDPVVVREVSLLTVRGRRRGRAADAFIRLAKAYDWISG